MGCTVNVDVLEYEFKYNNQRYTGYTHLPRSLRDKLPVIFNAEVPSENQPVGDRKRIMDAIGGNLVFALIAAYLMHCALMTIASVRDAKRASLQR